MYPQICKWQSWLYLGLMVLILFSRIAYCKFVRSRKQPTIQRTMNNYWRFDFSTGFTDSITRASASFHGNLNNISIQGSRDYNGYLSINDHSSVELNGVKSSCFSDPFTCTSGVSMVMWFRDPTKDHVTYFNSKGGAFSLLRYSKKSLVVKIINKTEIHESIFSLNTSIWNHMAFTWDTNTGLTIYGNSRKLSTHIYVSYNRSSLTRKTSHDSSSNSLFLRGRGSFDDIMVWHKTLSALDIKKIFQSQINSIINASCEPGTTSLNVSWQHSRDVYNTIASYHVRLRKGRKSRKKDAYELTKTATNAVFENLLPMTSYRIKIWAETENGDIIKTEVVRCQTKEGGPERVINFKATPLSSSSVFIHWIPPSRINGLLKGYQVNVSDRVLTRRYFIHGKQSYLIERLKENTTFDITIAAVNGRGPGWSTTVTVTTKIVPIITAQPQRLQAAATDWRTIHVQWLPLDPAMEVKTYEIRACISTDCTSKHSRKPSVVLEGLEQYTAYKIQVRATNKRSKGPWLVMRQSVRTLDFDECLESRRVCSRYALCHNTHRSYLCTCLPGYAGNGTVCTRINDKLSTCSFQIAEDLSWHLTNVGQQARVLCPEGSEGIAVRYCGIKERKATWGRPNLEGCISERILSIQKRLITEGGNQETITGISYELAQATSLTNGLTIFGGDVTTTVKIVKTLDEIRTKNTSGMGQASQRQFSSNIAKVASNILDAANIKSWKQIPVISRIAGASQLMESLDSITMTTASLLTDNQPVTQTASNVVVNMQSFPFNQMIGYVTYPIVPLDGSSISLPLDDVRPVSNDTGIKTYVSFIYLQNIGVFLTENDCFDQLQENKTQGKDQEAASSDVLSLTTSQTTTKTFKKPVIVTLKNPPHEKGMEPVCVYWNKSEAHSGSWSSYGCSVNSSNISHTVCHCNHLTSFSVLMQHRPVAHLVSNQHNFALSIITYVGVGISTVALFLALVTFAGCTFLKSTRNFAHINLTLSLLLAEVLFLAGIDKTQYFLPCRIVAIFLHYLFLVVFCWMASEGIILYFMLVRVFPSETSGPRKRLFFVCSWGLPCVFVAFTSSFYFQGYGNNNYCWLSIDDGFIWSFLAPVLLISLVNLVFLSMTFKAMANRSTPQSANKKKTFKHWVKACAVLTCLLGTTWLLGLFYVNKNSLVMAYLFNIFNSLQGLLIFIFHCVFDERVRSEYYRIICCLGSRRDRLRQKSTGTLTFRKLTSASSGQMRKFHQSSSDGKATNSGSTGFGKNYLDSSQNGIPDVFDSDSLLTINKTSADEHAMTDDHEEAHSVHLKTPTVDINSDTEYDSMDYSKQKEQSWGEHLTESLFNVSSIEEWDSRSSKRISRPLSEDTSSLSLPRSIDYYSDGDYNRYTTDLSDIYQSETGSHPVIQTEEGTIVRLGRCNICSNDSYQMVCVHNEDNVTQASFECVEETPSLQCHSTTDASCSSAVTVPSERTSFDESILTGFLRDAHPNPKIINYRWTHIPYIKKSEKMPQKNFMTESSSCDDRFLRYQGDAPRRTWDSSETSSEQNTLSNNSLKVCSKTSLHKNDEEKQNIDTDLGMNMLENPIITTKPVGLVAPIMAPSTAELEDELSCPPVALAESIEELHDLDSELKEFPNTNTSDESTESKINRKPSDVVYKSFIQVTIMSPQPKQTQQERDKTSSPYTKNERDFSTLSRLPIYPHSTTATRKEMSSIKQGIVQRLGQVFESGWPKLYAHNGESDTPKRSEIETRRNKDIEKKSQPPPGNVRNLREIFETQAPVLDH